MKIIEYRILHEQGLYEMEGKVNDYIRNGWQPYGHPCFIQGKIGESLRNMNFQAMVKYEEIGDSPANSDYIDSDYEEKLRNCKHPEAGPHSSGNGTIECRQCGKIFGDPQFSRQLYFNADKCPHQWTHTIGETKALLQCKQCGTIFNNGLKFSEESVEVPAECEHEWRNFIFKTMPWKTCIKCEESKPR